MNTGSNVGTACARRCRVLRISINVCMGATGLNPDISLENAYDYGSFA